MLCYSDNTSYRLWKEGGALGYLVSHVSHPRLPTVAVLTAWNEIRVWQMLFSLSMQFLLFNLKCFAILKCLGKPGCGSVKWRLLFIFCVLQCSPQSRKSFVLGNIIYIWFFKMLPLAKSRPTSVSFYFQHNYHPFINLGS